MNQVLEYAGSGNRPCTWRDRAAASGAAVQMPDVRHVRVQLADGQPVIGMGRVTVTELQRRRIGVNPVPDYIIREPGAVGPVGSDVFSRGRQPGVEEVLFGPGVCAQPSRQTARRGVPARTGWHGPPGCMRARRIGEKSSVGFSRCR